jgi:hypothetical protein
MAYIANYQTGNLIRLTVAITVTATGAPISPSGLTLKMKTPDGITTDISSTIVNDSTGNYHADFPVVQSGLHTYQWTGVGAAQVATLNQFNGVIGI